MLNISFLAINSVNICCFLGNSSHHLGAHNMFCSFATFIVVLHTNKYNLNHANIKHILQYVAPKS